MGNTRAAFWAGIRCWDHFQFPGAWKFGYTFACSCKAETGNNCQCNEERGGGKDGAKESVRAWINSPSRVCSRLLCAVFGESPAMSCKSDWEMRFLGHPGARLSGWGLEKPVGNINVSGQQAGKAPPASEEPFKTCITCCLQECSCFTWNKWGMKHLTEFWMTICFPLSQEWSLWISFCLA